MRTGTVLLLLCTVFAVQAQRSSELSADLPSARTLAVQQKVETLFETGEFERAFFIYRNELVPLGDKYAQYMVGYMFETGTGTEKDRIAASAWYRLAADRGTPEFVAVRDQMLRSLEDGERARSDAEFLDIRREYSDLAVLLASIKRDLKALETRTGSRLKGDSSLVTIVDPRGGNLRSGADYYGGIHSQLADRMQLLIEIGGFEDLSSDPDDIDLDELERLVNEKIESGTR